MKNYIFACLLFCTAMSISSCELVDNDEEKHIMDKNASYISLSEVTQILSALPISQQHVKEVHDAVTASSSNGYDEEYTMKNLFAAPGSGVGDRVVRSSGGAASQAADCQLVRSSDDKSARSSERYNMPLCKLIQEHLHSRVSTRSAVDQTLDRLGVDGFLHALEESDIQIYWPFSENHSSDKMPIITFDPEDGSDVNIGYRLIEDGDGFRHVEEVIVDEEMAEEYPVWVVNRNSDAGYSSLEMLRREDPDWGEGGGDIIVNPKGVAGTRSVAGAMAIADVTGTKPGAASAGTKTGEVSDGTQFKTLILKDFIMKRNYDSWFAGASEFFVKVGSVEDFTASTEAELRLYSPSVTDFMIVVKRSQIGQPLPFNAVLVTDWSDQMTHCAFMITEDDGGTITTWDCTALVRVASKSYGVEIKIPFNSRDDVVWRGQLASSWLEKNSSKTAHFGDVDLTFELVE